MGENTIKTEPETKPIEKVKKLRKRAFSTKMRVAKVMRDVVVNGSSMKTAMRNNGYKAGYQPARITQTKTWAELLAKDLPDKLLSKVARQGLKAKTGDKAKDFDIRHKYLETSLKMAGKLKVDDNPAGLVGLVVGFKMIQPKDTAQVIEGETIEGV